MGASTIKHYTVSDTTYSIELVGEHFIVSIPAEQICIAELDSMNEALSYIGADKPIEISNKTTKSKYLLIVMCLLMIACTKEDMYASSNGKTSEQKIIKEHKRSFLLICKEITTNQDDLSECINDKISIYERSINSTHQPSREEVFLEMWSIIAYRMQNQFDLYDLIYLNL